uniref:aspartate kinase n=1 Tax=viral metagenome TaxID=1070528 RepID=A0A6C0ECX3_9ZZZZ
MAVTVIKLGGTSQCKVGYDELVKVIKGKNEGDAIVIVLSAVSGVTNELINFTETKSIHHIDAVKDKCQKLLTELGLHFSRIYDEKIKQLDELCDNYKYNKTTQLPVFQKAKIIGYGEELSTTILSEYFEYLNIKYSSAHARRFIRTKKNSYVLYPSTEFFANQYNFSDSIPKFGTDVNVVITEGFIASTPSGDPVLLGRGGSDTTGALLANMLDADEYQVWTDVDGIYTSDPRVIKNSKKVDFIDYKLIQELSSMGAKVMHALSIYPCEQSMIPITVKNTFAMEKSGTVISNVNNNELFFAIQKNVTLFKIKSLSMSSGYGFVNQIFQQFTNSHIDVSIVTTSQFEICTTTEEPSVEKLLELKVNLEENYEVTMMANCIVVSFVASDIKKYSSKIDLNIVPSYIIHFGSNGMTLNFVIDQSNYEKFIEYVNELFE